GDPGEWPGDQCPTFIPEIHEHPFHDLLDVFRRNEGSLEVDLGELGLAIRAKVFVTKAAGDLKVPIIPRYHQQLLVDLGTLRQRIELPGVNTTRHQVVARAFGRRLGENRSLDVETVEGRQSVARALKQAVAEDQVALQLRATQVQDPVLEAELLRRQLLLLLPGNRNRWRLRGPDNLEVGDM